jgi:hypothetical protein
MAQFILNGYDSYSGCDIVVTATLPMLTEDGSAVNFTLGSLQTLSVSTHQEKRPVRSLGNVNAKDYVMGQRTIAGSLVFAVFDRHFAHNIMRSTKVTMADEIPALDLTINFANEYGRSSHMRIFGVKLINEGQVMSINDLYTENTYQFVALGLEPLKADDDISVADFLIKGSRFDEYVGADETLTSARTIQSDSSEGKVYAGLINNNKITTNKEIITLTATVEQPIPGEDTGIASLSLMPNQLEGNIYITDLMTNKIISTVKITGSLTYGVELPVGYYNAKYMNTIRTNESNIEKIVVKAKKVDVDTNIEFINYVFPVIENVNYNSISVSMFNKEYNNIICYESGGDEITLINNSPVVVFNELKNNTEYNIYAKSDNKISNTITIKTFETASTYFNNFVTYLQSNQTMLQNDFNELMDKVETLLDYETKRWPYITILDGIQKLENSLAKQELMLYAILFENSMIESYNEKNPYKLKIDRQNLFDVDLVIDNWNSTSYYSRDNGKERLEGIISEGSIFMGRPNKTYSLYGTNGSISSIKKYLTVFNSEGKEGLVKYKDINKYKEIDLNYYKALYPTLDNEELYAIAIKENNLCMKQILEEPYVYKDGDILYANVTYDDKVLLGAYYYLCVSEMYSTIDLMPKRKIPFNRHTKIINLSESYIPFDSDKIYHFWIEDHTGAIISNTHIFNYKQSSELNKVQDKELLKLLNNKKTYIVNKLKTAEEQQQLVINSIITVDKILTDIVNELYSNNVPRKDIDLLLEIYTVLYGYSSNNLDSVIDLLYNVIIANAIDKILISRQNKLSMNESAGQMKVIPNTDLSTKVVVKHFKTDSDECDCKIYNTNIDIPIKDGYTAIYLLEEKTNKILGLSVLQCQNYSCVDYRTSGFEMVRSDISYLE